MEVVNGVLFHAVGASSASLCYTPQKKLQGWSWQSYWMAQAFICWLILPVVVAFITIPQLLQVLHEAPSAAMQRSFFLGMAYGVGGTAFGVAIRYVGFSLTYAISVGISCVLGTILPPLINGKYDAILRSVGSPFLIAGVIMGATGIAICGIAGRSKEKDLEKGHESKHGFSLAKGLPLCLAAGILSAMYGFSLDQAQPIADVASKYGAGNFQENVKYIFSNTGAFVTTILYCLYLHIKKQTFNEYTNGSGSSLRINYMMSILTGILWYGQFFFYGLGHVRMGTFKFTSWGIHMIMLVLFSSVAGLILKEWKHCSRKTMVILCVALLVLIMAVLSLAYGNYLGNE